MELLRIKKRAFYLDGILCKAINKNNGEDQQTDINGHFEVHGPFGGCMPNFSDIIIKVSKSNYKALETKNTSDTIFHVIAQKK